jgi:hypothetical protein
MVSVKYNCIDCWVWDHVLPACDLRPMKMDVMITITCCAAGSHLQDTDVSTCK